MTKELVEIKLTWSDRTYQTIYKQQLDDIENLMKAIAMLERARNIYDDLKNVFDRGNLK